MSDPKKRLTLSEVEAAGLADWRFLLSGIRARFRTGDFATGLELVERIGAAAEEADHHPDVSLTYPEVIVDLVSHDVDGVTSRDVDLACRISEFAADLGAEADTSGLTQLEPGLDTTSKDLGPFYAALLGGEVSHGSRSTPAACRPTRGSDGSRRPSMPAARWSATPRLRRTGCWRTPTAIATACARAPGAEASAA